MREHEALARPDTKAGGDHMFTGETYAVTGGEDE